MEKTQSSKWFGIRSIYLFGMKNDGTNIFEERIVVFTASSSDEALSKAEHEAKEYATSLQMSVHPYMVLYWQDGEALIDGYEVWSELYESSEDIESFVKSRYDKYDYHPDS
jgi:hypothetical protein